MPLTGQRVHQRSMHPGPLVLGMRPIKFRTPTADKDQTVSRRFEPSSRTTLIGEQPNPWELLRPQDVMSRHRTYSILSYGADYIFFLSATVGFIGHGLLLYDKSRRITLRAVWL